MAIPGIPVIPPVIRVTVVDRRHLAAIVAVSLAALPRPARAGVCTSIPVWRDGARDGSVCREAASEHGLTVLDLSDDWAPPVLAPAGDGGASYRATYLALAQERFADAGGDAALAPSDRYFELFGIAPSPRVVAGRLADEARHRCHDEIDDDALAATTVALREGASSKAIRPAVRAVQAHLACDGLFLAHPVDGAYTWQTSDAVERFQRGAFLLPTGVVDAETRDALALGSRERDLRTALRVLRERVVAATGLIEDGSAGVGPGTVLGRALDPPSTWSVRGAVTLADAAPDRISAATEAAARALGWRDAQTTADFLAALSSPELAHRPREFAVELPAPPSYHTAAMDLAVEIDRGDARPWADGRGPRPSLVLYARDGEHRLALVRWPTTIGGWQDQVINGATVRRWKPSPTGPRVWRDILVGPRWLPPETTPDRELVRGGDGHYVLARSTFGPSYRAAFGLVALVHLMEEHVHGTTVVEDQGIRTHGTGNLTSLATGDSHGCHRLLGRNVVRLADFLLAHHAVIRHGDAPTFYQRVVHFGGWFPITITTLGYRIELVPPVTVDVLPGRVR